MAGSTARGRRGCGSHAAARRGAGAASGPLRWRVNGSATASPVASRRRRPAGPRAPRRAPRRRAVRWSRDRPGDRVASESASPSRRIETARGAPPVAWRGTELASLLRQVDHQSVHRGPFPTRSLINQATAKKPLVHRLFEPTLAPKPLVFAPDPLPAPGFDRLSTPARQISTPGQRPRHGRSANWQA